MRYLIYEVKQNYSFRTPLPDMDVPINGPKQTFLPLLHSPSLSPSPDTPSPHPPFLSITSPYISGADSWGTGGTCPHFYQWLGTGFTVSRTAN